MGALPSILLNFPKFLQNHVYGDCSIRAFDCSVDFVCKTLSIWDSVMIPGVIIEICETHGDRPADGHRW